MDGPCFHPYPLTLADTSGSHQLLSETCSKFTLTQETGGQDCVWASPVHYGQMDELPYNHLQYILSLKRTIVKKKTVILSYVSILCLKTTFTMNKKWTLLILKHRRTKQLHLTVQIYLEIVKRIQNKNKIRTLRMFKSRACAIHNSNLKAVSTWSLWKPCLWICDKDFKQTSYICTSATILKCIIHVYNNRQCRVWTVAMTMTHSGLYIGAGQWTGIALSVYSES